MKTHFTLQESCQAIGMPVKTAQNWIDRKLVLGSEDKPAGKHERFSFHTVMEIAVANSLKRISIPLEICFEVAVKFAHFGSSSNANNVPNRLPATPFLNVGRSAFIGFNPIGDRPINSIVSPDGPLSKISAVNANNCEKCEIVIWCDAGPVFRRVCLGLGHEPEKIILMRYGQPQQTMGGD